MFTEQIFKNLAIFLMAFGLLSCSAAKAPKGTVPTLDKISETANGGWVTFQSEGKDISGELIGFKEDSIFVLTDKKLLSLSQNNVHFARLIFYNTKAENYGGWAGLNSLFTIANGWFLIFTFPINLIVGSSVTVGESNRINFIDFPEHPWTEFHKFARFPQGLLDTIDRNELEF
ncbi:hypothetical protein [Aquiflexum sp.]|uniref:hypothetical protein n=1 Tax=Aquiflexum sp. TaxID=1872584 RepID=UPI0035949102